MYFCVLYRPQNKEQIYLHKVKITVFKTETEGFIKLYELKV
jgi:hypothetical protein